MYMTLSCVEPGHCPVRSDNVFKVVKLIPNMTLAIGCVIITGFIGWSLCCLLTGRKGFASLYLSEKIGLSIPLGFGVISLQMFVAGFFGIKFTVLNILLPWVPVILIAGWRCYGKRVSSANANTYKRIKPFTRTEFAILGLIAFQAAYNFFRALIKPIESYDAVAIYGLKSKILYLAGTIEKGFFSGLASNFHGAHPDYPLLLPLSETWIYTFMGSFNDIAVKLLFPCFYLALILIFYSAVMRITQNRVMSLLFTFLLASIKQLSDYATIGYADLFLGLYFSMGIFYLYVWFTKRESHFFNLTVISFLLCLWTKNEGVVLALIALTVFAIYLFFERYKIQKKDIIQFLILIFVILLTITGWEAVKIENNLTNENINVSMLRPEVFIPNLYKIPKVLYEYQKQLFGFKKWNLIWILFFILLIKEFKRSFSGNVKYLTYVFCMFLCLYTLVYIFSVVDVRFLVSKTFSRFLLHILPVAVFWMAIVSGEAKLLKME